MLGLRLDITPDAEIEVIFRQEFWTWNERKGFWFITFKINTLGKFNMWGDFSGMKEVIISNMEDYNDKKFVKKVYYLGRGSNEGNSEFGCGI
jgi:hypothetical protein